MTEYTLMADFHIDGGELDGTPPNEAFVLGVEWQQVRSIVSTLSEIPAAIDIHKANAGRLAQAAWDQIYTLGREPVTLMSDVSAQIEETQRSSG